VKILLVTTYGFFFPSWPEHLQARALARRGHSVAAYAYYDAKRPGSAQRHEWLPGGVAIHRCRTWGFFSPDLLLRMLRAERPDIVHLHHLRNLLGFQTVALAGRLGLPVVLTPHGLLHDGDLVADRERPLERPPRFDGPIADLRGLARAIGRGTHPRRAARNYLIHAPLRWIDGAVALSQHERGLLARIGVPPDRTVVLPNALELDAFDATAAEATSLGGDELHPGDGPMVLFVGQLIERKGFDLLARAMPLVLREHPRARFVFVSHNLRGETELRRLAAEGGAEHAMRLIYRPDEAEKLRLLRSASVLAAPSRYEGFGIMLVEAMAAGAPVITTDVPTGNEIVRHERNGLLTPYDDVGALAAAISRLLSDRALAASLAAEGRRSVERRYTAERLAADLEAWYRSVIERTSREQRRRTGAAP
jgi:glycosyltransferase involved in cell wall biosynthesis